VGDSWGALKSKRQCGAAQYPGIPDPGSLNLGRGKHDLSLREIAKKPVR
jgi:hypothetical protein